MQVSVTTKEQEGSITSVWYVCGYFCGWDWEVQTATAGPVKANRGKCFLGCSRTRIYIPGFLKYWDNDKEYNI